MATPKPRRPWYQFSLRTMLLTMIVASAAFGWWVHRSREWIRQRHEALANGYRDEPFDFHYRDPGEPYASWLRLFGETALETVICADAEFKNATRLFPEARIVPESEWYLVAPPSVSF